jgi:hypothetical protein
MEPGIAAMELGWWAIFKRQALMNEYFRFAGQDPAWRYS